MYESIQIINREILENLLFLAHMDQQQHGTPSKVILSQILREHCKTNGYKCSNQRLNDSFSIGCADYMQLDGIIKNSMKKYVFSKSKRLLAAVYTSQNDHCFVSFLSFCNISIVFCTKLYFDYDWCCEVEVSNTAIFMMLLYEFLDVFILFIDRIKSRKAWYE